MREEQMNDRGYHGRFVRPDKLPNEERNAEIIARWNTTDLSLTDLARDYGVTRSAIAGILTRARKRGEVTRLPGSPVGLRAPKQIVRKPRPKAEKSKAEKPLK